MLKALPAPSHTSTPPAPITLDRTSFVPFYRQIADQVKETIQSGAISPGTPFWSEGELATELAVSKMTVRQAFQVLRTEGLLTVAKGKRPLIAAGRLQKNTQELRGFTEEMMRRGLKPSSKVLLLESVVPGPEICEALKLGRNDEVFVIRRLRLADNQPVGVETSHLPARLFPGLDHQNLEKRSLYSLLETHFGVKLSWSEEEIEAIPAGKEEADLLQIKRGAALLCLKRNVYSVEGELVEHARSLYRGDRYAATVVSRRGPF
ncbi:MAG TPA: GntR family transcriptional regulator [Bryobacteraceae bacterium]